MMNGDGDQPGEPPSDLSDDARTLLMGFRTAIVEPGEEGRDKLASPRGTLAFTLAEVNSDARKELTVHGLIEMVSNTHDVFQYQLTAKGRQASQSLF